MIDFPYEKKETEFQEENCAPVNSNSIEKGGRCEKGWEREEIDPP
ncbi:MAG TPA: hypothetical protein VKV95_04985 [Terriglobia bacterium]|nr:hypothetical protein [Terriglobia bacterium]